MKRIVLTGGGTAGHVTPNMALIPGLKKAGFEIHYIGSYDGIEKELIEKMGVPYYGISSGKLRRYFDPKNFSDPLKVMKGYKEAKAVLNKLEPSIVFSKGGFVSVPVVYAARKLHIPSIIHESDMSPGLANKLCLPCATKICANFPEALKNLPEGKAVLTGTPIREELFHGSKSAGLNYCGFVPEKPVLLIVGGSSGAIALNQAVRSILPELLKQFQIIHLCGKGKADAALEHKQGYRQYEYIEKELCDLFAAADVIVSRAGANAICELLALKKPNILIPLPASSSRGDQILNANSFAAQGYSFLLQEDTLTDTSLLSAVKEVYQNRDKYRSTMGQSQQSNAIPAIIDLIKANAK